MSLISSSIIAKPYELFYYHFLSEKVPGATLSELTLEIDPTQTIQKIKTHKWTRNEIAHYGFLLSVFAFVFIVHPASIINKIPIFFALAALLTIPLFSQFFLPALPILTWLCLFFSVGKIPAAWKPAISVKTLPAMETILYSDNLSAVLATFNNSFLDVLAWIPYGLLHFGAPFVVAALVFIFGPPTALKSYGFAFGYMNLIGVLIQIFFPAAPPWYKILHGLDPANYSMKGSPGGLGRIDQLLGFDMYTTTFSNSPVIFGAFPSLHSGCATMDAYFMCYLFPKFTPVWCAYVMWLWWSTMYLTHHYFIDLMAGAVLSFAVFQYTRYTHLPVNEPSKFCRWSYLTVKKLDISAIDPLLNFGSYNRDVEDQFNEDQFLSISNGLNTNTLFEMSNLVTHTRSRTSSRVNASTLRDLSPISPDGSASPSVFEETRLASSSSSTSLDELDSKHN